MNSSPNINIFTILICLLCLNQTADGANLHCGNNEIAVCHERSCGSKQFKCTCQCDENFCRNVLDNRCVDRNLRPPCPYRILLVIKCSENEVYASSEVSCLFNCGLLSVLLHGNTSQLIRYHLRPVPLVTSASVPRYHTAYVRKEDPAGRKDRAATKKPNNLFNFRYSRSWCQDRRYGQFNSVGAVPPRGGKNEQIRNKAAVVEANRKMKEEEMAAIGKQNQYREKELEKYRSHDVLFIVYPVKR
ncbi:hypothetical protein GWI33_005418 [Rhynchophorus ferrugineus]|uniref:Uncharacterized protein n=1 Tax=Rhynchophorus ferrugineus TaxID=354439 RepID=A0A834IMY8_RHYFE|nr:hypothetical protein GWI33_005418 [Rhynchophorus ferrugineus]